MLKISTMGTCSLMITLVLSLLLSPSLYLCSEESSDGHHLPRPLIMEYPDGVAEQEGNNLECTSWRVAVEANNLNPWKTIPQECGEYVRSYMIGRGYKLDFEKVSNEASVFANSVNVGDDSKAVWVFDVDETLLSNLPYYAHHGYGMQTQSAVSAANLLIQSAEAALPKQKRGVAAAEFKQSKIAYKRRAKGQQEDKDLILLPQDVLVHVFSFLDMQSLVSTGLVCWSWNEAANDSYLWQLHYNTHFGELESTPKTVELQGGSITCIAGDNQLTASDGICKDADYDWKDAFRRAYIALSPCQRYKYFRGYCAHCNSIVWLKNLKCPNQHPGRRLTLLNLLSSSQIAMYILGDNSWWEYSSDSDSESDDQPGLKFWTYT